MKKIALVGNFSNEELNRIKTVRKDIIIHHFDKISKIDNQEIYDTILISDNPEIYLPDLSILKYMERTIFEEKSNVIKKKKYHKSSKNHYQ